MTNPGQTATDRPRRAALAAISLAVMAPSLAVAGGTVEVEEVPFLATQAPGGDALRLHGGAKLKWLLFDVYVGGLYLPPESAADRALEDIPKRLEFHYLVSIDGKDFGPAGEKILQRNFTPEELAPLADRLARIRAAYRDVKEGDRYALTYLPGVGTELSLNGVPLVTIEGADFARAYFSIWLGKKPLDEGFRRELLRGLPVAVSLR
jgi:hypothetical protein